VLKQGVISVILSSSLIKSLGVFPREALFKLAQSHLHPGAGMGGEIGLNRVESGIGLDQAIWNRSNGRAGEWGGALADKPRWVRILAITGGCPMAAIIVKVPPQ